MTIRPVISSIIRPVIGSVIGQGDSGDDADINFAVQYRWRADSGLTLESGVASAWTDTVEGYTLTQATSENRPTLASSSINGKPALLFEGNEWLMAAMPAALAAIPDGNNTMLVVLKELADDPAQIIVGGLNNGGAQRWGHRVFNSTKRVINNNTFVTVNSAIAVTGSRNDSQILIRDGNSITVNISGNVVTAASDAANPSFTTSNNFIVGRQSAASFEEPAKVAIAEIVIMNTAITESQLENWHQYVTARYDIAIGADVLPTIPVTDGLKLWLDADDLATISVTGTDVTQWNDKSGNNFHVTQETGSLRPQYNSELKSIDFLGNGIKLARAAALLPAGSSHTILFAASRIDNSAGDFNDTIIEQGNDSGNWGIRLKTPISGSQRRAGHKIITTSTSTNGATNFDYTTGVNRVGLFEWNQSTNTSTSFINATQVRTETLAGTILGNLNIVQIGSRTDVVTSVRLHEVLIYNRVLSTAEKDEANAYLATKWGIIL